MIRDNALAVSGLLVRDDRRRERPALSAGGLLAVPQLPQARVRRRARAPDQYRRGLYTHWQRTLLHPGLLAFDAPSREMCTAKRPISNTPQAALALLNDPSSRRGGPRAGRAGPARRAAPTTTTA